MQEEFVFPLKRHPNHFISHKGYVFFVSKSREYDCPRRIDEAKRIYVKIEGKEYDLAYLMLEYFYPRHNPGDTAHFMHTPDLKIPSRGIKFKKTRVGKFTDTDQEFLLHWKCNIKAGAANSRCAHRVTGIDVLHALKKSDFKCIYCGDNLVNNNWHLDHFIPISRNGKNHPKNLAPSCRICNIMKGAQDGYSFIRQCKKIILKHRLGHEEVKINPKKENRVLERIDNPDSHPSDVIIVFDEAELSE